MKGRYGGKEKKREREEKKAITMPVEREGGDGRIEMLSKRERERAERYKRKEVRERERCGRRERGSIG